MQQVKAVKTVFNAPIPTLKDFNRNKIVNFKQIYADNLIKLKKYAETNTGFGCSLDKNGNPATGLTEDKQFKDAKGKMQVIPGTRKEMERLMGLAEGTLKNTSVYWLTWFVKTDADVLTLDLNDDHDLLKYLFLYAQSIVAVGHEEIEVNAKAEYVLYSEEQEAEVKVKGRKSLKRSYAISEKLDLETKINILAIAGFNADASAPNSIDNKIDEIIEADPEVFLKIVEDSNLIHKSLLSKAMDAGIIIVKEGNIHHNEVLLGHDHDAAASAIAKSDTLQAVLKAKLSGDMELLQKVLSESKED